MAYSPGAIEAVGVDPAEQLVLDHEPHRIEGRIARGFCVAGGPAVVVVLSALRAGSAPLAASVVLIVLFAVEPYIRSWHIVGLCAFAYSQFFISDS